MRHPKVLINAALVSWLYESGSLTARCQAACQRFAVRLLACSKARSMTLVEHGQQQILAREVLLECDGLPVIFARTELALQPRGRLSCWLGKLGSRSLGSLLFSRPGFVRGEIECCCLDSRQAIFRRAASAAGLGREVKSLWARRSQHSLAGQTVLVTEIFLPAIERLPK